MKFSPKDPISMVGTFSLVLFFTMLKEAYEVIYLSLIFRTINDTSKTKKLTIN